MSAPELAEPGLWLGIDLGTQSVRALACDSGGTIVGMGAAPILSQRWPGRHEQQPEHWWAALCLATRAAMAPCEGRTILGLAVDATSGTVLLVDPQGKALGPALMYDDSRAIAEAAEANRIGASEWVARGFHRMQASWGLPKLLWLLRQHGGSRQAVRLAHQSDFITARLAGRPVATDTSHALKTGAAARDESWPLATFADLGIDQRILPPLVRPGVQIGEVCKAAAVASGVPAGTPIYAGMTDGCAAQIASGALAPGSWNSVLGTTLVLKGVSALPIEDPRGIVYSHRSPDGLWLPGGASSAGAGILAQKFSGQDLDELTRAAALRPISPLAAYPLATRGERFPFACPEAEGFLMGTPGDSVEHFAALLQGVAFLERLAFDYLDLLGAPLGGDLRLTGGATRNHYWSQLRADVLGRPVTIPEQAESALGMAVLAAARGRPLAEAAREMIRVRETLLPQVERTAELLPVYLRLVEELRERGYITAVLARHARRRATEAAGAAESTRSH